MTPNEYVRNAVKTESKPDTAILLRLNDQKTVRLLHAAMGLETEVGEFMDPLKKNIFYGKPIDYVNLTEEIGDLMWYIAVACDTLGVNLEDVMETNIAKLKARYGEKFSEDAAVKRNLEVERKILERKY